MEIRSTKTFKNGMKGDTELNIGKKDEIYKQLDDSEKSSLTDLENQLIATIKKWEKFEWMLQQIHNSFHAEDGPKQSQDLTKDEGSSDHISELEILDHKIEENNQPLAVVSEITNKQIPSSEDRI